MAWLPYALLYLLNPDFLAGVAGVSSTSPTGMSEVRAMYGGLQAGIGILALLGAARPAFTRPALLMLLYLASGLGLARLVGVMIDDSLSGYTVGALAFEAATAFVAASCLRRTPLEGSRPAAESEFHAGIPFRRLPEPPASDRGLARQMPQRDLTRAPYWVSEVLELPGRGQRSRRGKRGSCHDHHQD